MPPIAPRPFCQLARRCWRLRIELPRGYFGGLSAPPWYRRMRRRARPNLRKRRDLMVRMIWDYVRYLACEVA
jgi:hypothetical protein